ncbi:COP9 signalosome complex subunit 8 [Coccinella septempunctata]|uniref:COP9 signalosome complex subunit 8 n=1 Tax=Coccinella septempunctata TaxID=41139 RepID=UPI001D080043|nr:COP9 signalosome complex subunit 8 [Coccinella septempunctata]
MDSVYLDNLMEDLEKREIEATNDVPTEVYEKLLAIYLYKHDLCNAKFLWKRIPAKVKASTPELGNIWSVGQYMWKKDYPSIYKSLNSVTWSNIVSDIMQKVEESVRNRAVDLISQAYSSISLDTVCAMTGLAPDICSKACIEKEWKYEADTKIVHPVKTKIESIGTTSSEDQLYKLTDFVSFLEN